MPSSHPLATLAFATLRAAFASLPEVCGSSMCAIFAERSNCFTWSSTRNMKPPRSFLNKGTSSSTTMPSISEAHEIAHVASAAATNLPSSHMVFVSTEFLSKHKKWTATERSSRAAIARSIARNAGRSRGVANQAPSESRPTRLVSKEARRCCCAPKGPGQGFVEPLRRYSPYTLSSAV